jgi:hydroxyacylglutathione hydrolase
LIIKKLPVGPLMTNCFVLGCEETKEAVVIDPGDDADKILMTLAQSALTLKYIINTHGHFDHVGANKQLKEATGADILIHKLDEPMLGHLKAMAASFGLPMENSPAADGNLDDNDTVRFGKIEMKVLFTPGHSPGGISLFTDKAVFVGDSLFYGSIGRTDLPGGDYDTLINSIKNRLFVLGDDVTVYSGHTPETTIGQEKRHNPFVGENAVY